ncbi:MAG: single-stranded DNA-binding protein [Clostridium sp.]|uniref:single-stranded DNA-binding protein n=1 Tax=Clostridium sp. TaxID=1506 RepID=UPI0025C49EC2|nr:single-stranded DNA-binding protein [Clostridium sp.]MCH3964232.1 single-stranded DNA-binding protein [Clostridium sp.]MCI1715413.1 single-stranded DNA-binding protein [Clostridium sp.]MCI1799796.1 single-stranded DNA-binding protein [Clostridium sp.]MCI1813596.1 single-stranded DNA-binding protein [Clostridium sp.]MCI1870614.1 single-stranded DNA-binding protein [Clostridium sp.]
MNNVTLIGRLTKDAELFKIENSKRGMLKFILAVDKNFTTRNGEKQADFISVTYFSGGAEKLQQYLKKGRLLGVNGKITTRSYTKGDTRRYYMNVEADTIQFLEYKKETLA